MIRARSTRPVGSVRDRDMSSKRCRCSASVGSAITRRGATTGSPNPIPHPPLTTSRPRCEVKLNILIFRNLYTSSVREPDAERDAVPEREILIELELRRPDSDSIQAGDPGG